MGFLEGWVTRDLVRMQYLNTIVGRCDGKEALCQQISDWVGQNTLWVRGKIQELRRKEEYWHHVGLFYDQMLGLYQGYKASLERPDEDPVTMEDIFTMNIFGDLEDLEQAFDTEAKEPAKVINQIPITDQRKPKNITLGSRHWPLLRTDQVAARQWRHVRGEQITTFNNFRSI